MYVVCMCVLYVCELLLLRATFTLDDDVLLDVRLMMATKVSGARVMMLGAVL